MQTIADICTVDLTRTRITLAEGVVFTPQPDDKAKSYHIELPEQSQFYRIGYAEYVFLSLLNGQTNFCEALATTAKVLGPDALPQDKATELYTWAIEKKVATFTDATPEPKEAKSGGSRLQQLNPFWIKLPLGCPQNILALIYPLFGWIFSPLATVINLCLVLAAGIEIAVEWQTFSAASQNVLAPDNWIWLLVAWIVLKIVHETAHGLVCQRYGGTVRETGVVFLFFAPLAYVDVTSSWSFRSRWHRIHTAAAGMYIELVLASVAVFVWMQTQSAVLSHLMYNIIVMASLATLIFNANPLMRFDGYFILSDLLNIPNLYSQASQTLRQTFQSLLFGTRNSQPTLAGTQKCLVLLYGMAALCWRLFICLTLALAASVMFHGAGIILSLAAMVAWFALPTLQALQQGHRMFTVAPGRALRGVLILASVTAAIFYLQHSAPIPFRETAPGIVSLPDGCVVRTDVAGFVDEVFVVDGQHVTRGERLIRISNDEVRLEYQNLLLELKQEQIRYQAALENHDAGTARVAKGNLKSIAERLAEAEKRFESLEVRATTTGIVVSRHLDQLTNTYVDEGEEVLLIDDRQSRELRVSVAQTDFAEIQQQLNSSLPVRIGTRKPLAGKLVRLIPRASRNLNLPALAATEGGPLAVVQNDTGDDRDKAQLAEQRFEAIVRLAQPPNGDMLPIGERGYVSLGRNHDTLGKYLFYGFRRWIDVQLKTALSAG